MRCSSFAGTVFEGGGNPCAVGSFAMVRVTNPDANSDPNPNPNQVGSFAMQLALPIHSDLEPLEERYSCSGPNPDPSP